MDRPVPAAPARPAPSANAAAVATPPKQKSRKLLWIIVVALLVVLAGGAGAAYWFLKPSRPASAKALAPAQYIALDPAFVVNLADTDGYWDVLGDLLAPQGHVGLVVEPAGALRIGDPYKAKCIGIHWEFMFARPRFGTADMDRQGQILAQVAAMVDDGRLRGTLRETLSPITAANLREAHRRLEAGRSIGKLVLSGW